MNTVSVNSGGVLQQDHSGYVTGTGPGRGTGHVNGGSGGGYGGNGGRGVGTLIAGQTYGSLYAPLHFGSPGGFGYDYGKMVVQIEIRTSNIDSKYTVF